MDLATAQTHLTQSLEALVKARNAASVSDGTRSVSYQNIADLEKQVLFWQRTVNDLRAQAAGNTNIMVRTPKWT